MKFENCYWCHEKQIAAIITDTWGCEVRPNETKDANQPWHWVVIPAMGLCMGEIFYLKELAEDCAKDKVYEFFFCGPPLIITGGTGSRRSIRRRSSNGGRSASCAGSTKFYLRNRKPMSASTTTVCRAGTCS